MYTIANVGLLLNNLNSSYITRRMSAYTDDSSAVPDIRVTFYQKKDIEVPAGRDFRRLDAWYWIAREGGGYTAIKQFSKYRATLLRADIDAECRNITVEYVDIGDHADITTDYMLHYCLGDLFAFCQTIRNACVLHSTAVAYKGQAILFSAPSETGKSTQARLWEETYPNDAVEFNDDTPIIRLHNDQVLACGTPWSGKTEINRNITVPLKSIVFLKQSPKNEIRKLTTIESVGNLLSQTRKPVFDSLMNRHIDILKSIIEKIPIYELSCSVSQEAVHLVHDTVFGSDLP